MRRYTFIAIALMLWSVTAVARERWVLFGAALGFRSGCDPSYRWIVGPVFHNTSASDQQITVVHQSGTSFLPSSINVRGGESVPLSSIVGGPPLTLAALRLDVPSDVAVEPRLEYESINPCSTVVPLGPSGKIAFPSFELIDAQQPQVHYGLDLGTQLIRVNVGVYNAAARAAIAVIELRRAACDAQTTSVVAIPPDTLLQVGVRVPPICASPTNPRTPFWMVNATVTVDQPSFSYATTVSNVQAPNVTFGVATR